MLQHPVCCVSCFCEKQNILLIHPFDSGKFQKWRWCSLSAPSMGYLGGDSLGSTLACSRPSESWEMFFAAFCQAARPNPFRHKEDIFRITNVQSVTGQTKWCVSENCCSGKKTGDIKERRFSALQSHVKYTLNLPRKKRSKTKLAKPTKYVCPFFPYKQNHRLELRSPSCEKNRKGLVSSGTSFLSRGGEDDVCNVHDSSLPHSSMWPETCPQMADPPPHRRKPLHC